MLMQPRNDVAYSKAWLDAVLKRRRLCFNPYSVSDSRLLEIAHTTGWGNQYDFTQIVTVHFTRLREAAQWRQFDGIFMRVGESQQEVFLHENDLTKGVIADDTLRQEHSYNGRWPIRNYRDVEKLVGKTFFVSMTIRGKGQFGRPWVAYRMHRLTGNASRDAAVIREAMCAAKIEILERIIAYPENPGYMFCTKNLFEYEPRLRRAINIIGHYPNTPIPQD